jgi:hypothetical protein
MTGSFEPQRAIDKDERVVDARFLAEPRHEHQRGCGRPRRIQPNVKQSGGGGIDGGLQPILLVVELNHGLVDGNVIRIRAANWCWSAFCIKL